MHGAGLTAAFLKQWQTARRQQQRRPARADGTYGVVKAVAHTHDPQVMYNLTVATAHTYFVGEGAGLVPTDKLREGWDEEYLLALLVG